MHCISSLSSPNMCVETPVSEVQGPTSDSESEIFCDSLDQLDTVKV